MKIIATESFRIPGTDTIIKEGQEILINEESFVDKMIKSSTVDKMKSRDFIYIYISLPDGGELTLTTSRGELKDVVTENPSEEAKAFSNAVTTKDVKALLARAGK